MNAYFQLENGTDGTYLRLYPSTDSGESLRYEEVFEYLNKVRIYDFDTKALHMAILHLREETVIKLIDQVSNEFAETMHLEVSEDVMKVNARFYPPSKEGALLNYQDIVNGLISEGIKVGGKDEVIENFFRCREYCKNYVIAEGIPLVYGNDASIEYFFNTDLNAKPKENEDGSVDFHHLDNIAHVSAGDVLAKLTSENPGKPGMNVYGAIVKPPVYQREKLKFGKNIELSKDKHTITAMVNGHASLVDDKVFVSNLYEVENVDVATGDIEYEGNVLVKGNVTSGFIIRAKGDIEIRGVVEGATLISDGQIILQRGIQGMSRGILKAKGNIISKFIESAKVNAGGYIHTESILHSKVSAKGEINIVGKRGYVTGGVVRSACLVAAKTIGSPMGTDTTIEVGADPNMKENYTTIIKEIKEFEKELGRIKPVITAYGKKIGQGFKFTKEQSVSIQTLVEQSKEITEKLKEHKKLAADLKQIFAVETNARIKVSDTVYPGVKLVISDCMLYVRDEKPHCQFIREDGVVKMIIL